MSRQVGQGHLHISEEAFVATPLDGRKKILALVSMHAATKVVRFSFMGSKEEFCTWYIYIYYIYIYTR